MSYIIIVKMKANQILAESRVRSVKDLLTMPKKEITLEEENQILKTQILELKNLIVDLCLEERGRLKEDVRLCRFKSPLQQ